MTIADTLTEADLLRERTAIAQVGETFASFEFADDEDYFLFAPEPNRIYAITVDSQVDTEIGLFSTPDLVRQRRNDDDGPGLAPQILVQTGATPEVILIEVDTPLTAEPGSDGIPGPLASYVLDIAEIEVLEPSSGPDSDPVGATVNTSGGLGIGSSVVGTITPGTDVDAYTVYLEADREYLFELEAVDPTFDTFLEFFDSTGTALGNDDNSGSGSNAALTVIVNTSGFYFVTASEADFADSGAYVLTGTNRGAALRPDGPDEVGETADQAQLIEAGIPVAGRIETAGDVDLYSVRLLEGTEYLLGALGYDGFDGAMILRDAAGEAILTIDDAQGSVDPLTLFTAGETAVFFLEIIGATAAETGGFDVGVFVVDPGETLASEAREIALIYEAGLNRAADEPGLNFWINAFEGDLPNGSPALSVRQVAQAFLDSIEFQDSIGDPDVISDFTLVTGLYENVLDRAADDPGRDFWLSVLAQPDVDAADLLIAFARSAENRANSETIDSLAYNRLADTWEFLPEATGFDDVA